MMRKGKSKQLQSVSDRLEKENNEMEERIVALKEMMQREREERERLGGSKWKSSMSPAETKIANSEKKVSKSKSQPKFKILNDMPLENYAKKSKTSRSNGIRFSICGQCEIADAKMECTECGETYCPPCFKRFHAKGAMRKHSWRTLDQERLSASKVRNQSQNEIMLGTSSSATNQAATNDAGNAATDNQQNGGQLLTGTYDEKESADAFQLALKEWRGVPAAPPSQKKKDLWVNPVSEQLTETRSCATEAESDLKFPVDLKLNFNSEMSYADRLILKKHRKDPQNGSVRRKGTSQNSSNRILYESSTPSPMLTAKQNGIPVPSRAPSHLTEHLRSISIQLLPSDEDDSKYASSDFEAGSPIVSEVTEDLPRIRSDRRTLSQMGRLAIVELSFSDPENDSKSADITRSVSAVSIPSMITSARPTRNGAQSSSPDASVQKQTHLPHPPSTPSSTYVARQKILIKKNKKTSREESDPLNVKKSLQSDRKKWKPPMQYVGLDSFFMAGVERENKENIDDFQTSKGLSTAASCPIITVGANDSWRPDSSLSGTGDRSTPSTFETKVSKKKAKLYHKHDSDSKRPNKDIGKKSTNSDKSKTKDRLVKTQSNSLKTAGTPKGTMTLSSNSTPRVSMTDFDFLSAMPPMSKGDDFNKIHRASTVTLFALSPQPPDIWNEDSEYELSTSPRMSTSSVDKSAAHESDEEDKRALEELSTEMVKQNKEGSTDVAEERLWEDDSLSIEDNDDGSGLTSSGDTDTYYDGDDSSDDCYDMQKQVKNLK